MQTMKSTKCSAAFRPLLAIASIFVTLASQSAFASGGSDECADMGCNSFFAPEVIDSPQETPFFRTYRDFYHSDDDTIDAQTMVANLNTAEWMAYLEQKVPTENLSQLIYKMSLADLGNLTLAMQGKAVALSPEAAAVKPFLSKVSDQNRMLQALSYLGFAKRAEPITTRRMGESSWDGNRNPNHDAEDAKEAATLLAASDGIINGLNDRFLINRYRFQVIRLQFYTKKFAEAQQTFAVHAADFISEDSLKYRFMEFGAGALFQDHKYGKANYLYSVIFAKFYPFKRRAYQGFSPQEQADWLEALSMAKNGREKQVLWQMLGIKMDGLEGIKQIYAIDPKSDLLPLLLVREVNAAEEDWTSNEFRKSSHLDSATDGIKTDLEATGPKRIEALKAIADAGNTFHPYLWNMAMAHLYSLAGELALADAYLNRAKADTTVTQLAQEQIRMTNLFLKIRGMKAVNAWNENFLASELGWIKEYTKGHYERTRAYTLNQWALNNLSRLYQGQGDFIRALMLKDEPTSNPYKSIAQVDSILAFLAKTGDSAFDAFLKSNYLYTVAELQEIRSLNLLYSGELQLAVDNLKLAGSDVNTVALRADPFMIHIKDCHDCDFEASHRKYTKASFAARMLAQFQIAQGTGEAAAMAAFQVANGFYNMTYYGNGRDLYQTKFGNLTPYSTYSQWEAGDHSADRSLNMDLAEKFYQMAVAKSLDKEFKAKATFMSAKAEQNRYYYSHGRDENDTSGDIHPGKYYRQLVSGFYDTNYYKEILKECGFFKTYADKHR